MLIGKIRLVGNYWEDMVGWYLDGYDWLVTIGRIWIWLVGNWEDMVGW